jgi:hypothetical protein
VSTDDELLGFIAECLDLLAQYSARGREDLLAERLLQDGVVRRIEILADAPAGSRMISRNAVQQFHGGPSSVFVTWRLTRT